MALSCTVIEIIDFKEYCDFEIRVMGYSVIESDTIRQLAC